MQDIHGGNRMKRVVLYNPAIATLNLGDEIIVDACVQELTGILPISQFASLCTHQPIGKVLPKSIGDVDYQFVCGTNLLKSDMLFGFRQWQISLSDTWFIKNAILLGCGWWQYQDTIDWYSRILWRRILSQDRIHSVRDEYTKSKLISFGINNIANTGCPTMWKLNNSLCRRIPQKRSDSVVTTLTDYCINRDADNYMLAILSKYYETVYIWPQGFGDIKYLSTLKIADNICVIDASLKAYDELLKQEDNIEYIGTRLHGGIRALQHEKRTLIIAVDNRAIEKKSDFNLNVMLRNELNSLTDYINANYKTNIVLNEHEIERFRQQF